MLWPLNLRPLHHFHSQVLKGPHWGYGGLILAAGIAVALDVLPFTWSPA